MPVSSHSCPHCGTSRSQVLRHREDVTHFFCESCSKEFTRPRDRAAAWATLDDEEKIPAGTT